MIQSQSTIEMNLRFPGQYWDKETGLHQNYFRDYSPARGRYIQFDPIGLWGGINAYGYAYNDPLGYIDPYGLWAWGDPIDKRIVDFAAGWGDTISFGITNSVRGFMGTNEWVNKCSLVYRGGESLGLINSLSIGWVGGVKSVARAKSISNWQHYSHTLIPRRVLVWCLKNELNYMVMRPSTYFPHRRLRRWHV
ncbi:RHS repeat-associated core domain-containing protein, partial [Comamonadaceae bacterium OH2545_COT-014]